MFDIEELRAHSNFQGIELCDKKLTFFYDETENVCKLSLTKDGVNSNLALTHDFLLGGIMYENEPVGIEELFSSFNLQTKELKYINISRNKSFERILTSKRITQILDWLIKNEVYIHYVSVNNLYYGIVDIIDSIINLEENIISIDYILELKSVFFHFCNENLQTVLSFLYKYNYPNIDEEKIRFFCDELIFYLSENKNDYQKEKSYLEIIIMLLKKAKDNNQLIFIQNNQNYIMTGDYFHFYQKPCFLYKYSIHHFDKENEVEKNFEKYPLSENKKKFINYDFSDSAICKYLQLSDVLMGLMRDLFYYLDQYDIKQLLFNKNERFIENIRKINTLIQRSNNFHMMLLEMINDQKIIYERYQKLQLMSSNGVKHMLEGKYVKK